MTKESSGEVRTDEPVNLAAQFLASLGPDEKIIWDKISPKAQNWLIAYLNCFPGPDRDFLISVTAGVPLLRTIGYRIIRDRKRIIFGNQDLTFDQIASFRRALKPFESIATKIEALPFEEEIVDPTIFNKHTFGKLGEGAKPKEVRQATGITKSQKKDPEVTSLLTKLEALQVLAASTPADLKSLFDELPKNSPNLGPLAIKYLRTCPTKAVKDAIIFKNRDMEATILNMLAGRALRGLLQDRFDKDVMGF